VNNLEAILNVEGLDAILIGPYDLSASMGLTAQFEHPDFRSAMEKIQKLAANKGIPAGVHVVAPSREELDQRLSDGFRFIAYSIDAVMLNSVVSDGVC
jgi:2-dehydro-3-deoxyglucarate aldolase